MPRRKKIPGYSLPKASGQARVRFTGEGDIYLGPYGSPESREKYARLVAERHSVEAPSFTAADGRQYASVSFDVSDRLADKKWLLRHAVGAGPWCSTPPDEAALWRCAAVVRGLPALDVLIGDYLDRPTPAMWRRAHAANRLRLHYRIALTPTHRKADISGFMAQMHQTFAEEQEIIRREWAEQAAGDRRSGRRGRSSAQKAKRARTPRTEQSHNRRTRPVASRNAD